MDENYTFNLRLPFDGSATEAQRVAGVIFLAGGGEPVFNFRGIVVLWGPSDPELYFMVTEEGVEIRYGVVDYPDNHTPEESSRLWRRLPLDAFRGQRCVRRIVDAARRARQAQFEPCRFCGTSTPVEERNEGACYGCQERHLGFIF